MGSSGLLNQLRRRGPELQACLSAIRNIEGNLIFSIWCRTRQRNVDRFGWQHPVFVPTLILLTTIIVIAAAVSQALAGSFGTAAGIFEPLARFLPLLGMAWLIPVAYSAVRDSLQFLGRPKTKGNWQDFLEQLADTPCSDEEFLVGAVRVCWPRLVVVAGGSALMLWLAGAIIGQTVTESPLGLANAVGHWQMYGPGVVLITAINGILGGLVTVLMCLILSRGLRHPALAGVGAFLYCWMCLANTTSWLETDFTIYASVHTSYFVFCALVAILIVVAMMLLTRWWAWARWVLAAGWGLALVHGVTWTAYWASFGVADTPLRKMLPYLHPFHNASWVGGLFTPQCAGISPAGIKLTHFAHWFDLAYPLMNDMTGWWRVVILTITQLVLIVVLAYFALDGIKRWRRGEE